MKSECLIDCVWKERKNKERVQMGYGYGGMLFSTQYVVRTRKAVCSSKVINTNIDFNKVFHNSSHCRADLLGHFSLLSNR